MISVVALFGFLVYFFTLAFVSRDWLWFQDGFVGKPIRVVVYNQGQITEYRSGQPGYDLLAGAIEQSLNSGVVRQSGIGMSAETLRDAYQKYVTVEAFFGQPVKLHAGFNTGHPTQMLFPISGRHSELSVVFLGAQGNYRINGPVIKDLQPLREALTRLPEPLD
jgi:hypothetical protein